jgi:hypothetical protein
MLFERIFPVFGAKPQLKSVTPEKLDNLGKIVKPKALALGRGTTYTGLRDSTNYEPPPYDFNLILKAVDTDSYAKQAFLKYKDLFWKEGWQIVGENFDAVDYLYQRISLMEKAMNRPFNSFLADVADQWIKFGNAFVAKAYGDLGGFYSNLSKDCTRTSPQQPTTSSRPRGELKKSSISSQIRSRVTPTAPPLSFRRWMISTLYVT